MSQANDSFASNSPGIDAGDLFRFVIASLPRGVVVVDSKGFITMANEPAARAFGYRQPELIGRSIDLILPDAIGANATGHRVTTVPSTQTPSPASASRLVGRRRDGSALPVQVEQQRMVTQPGTLVFVDTTTSWPSDRVEGATAGEQPEFGRLLSELSVQFINLQADRVDDAMRNALRRIGEALEFDCCTFFTIQPDGTLAAPVGWPDAEGPYEPIPIDTQFPWAFATLLSGRVVCFSSVDEIPDAVDRAGYRALGIKSHLAVPLAVAGRVVGGVGFSMVREERSWPAEMVHRLRVFATAFGNVLARRERDEALHTALDEVKRLRDQLHAENVYLQREVKNLASAGGIVGQSAALRRVIALVEQVAATDSTVLLLGETGTGKELLARQVHELSARRGRPMVRVNCAAIPGTLIESELFGREKGAFTGAVSRQIGRFELADQSTIFLDEIGDLPLDVQVKLLRVLEERQIERVGSPHAVRIDTRIVAATHQNLEEGIAEGTFREDLFYRLNVFPIQVPPLRERADDIPLLVWRFVEEFSKAFGKRIDAIPRENLTALQQYHWRGNIRELRNAVERAMILTTTPRLSIPVPSAPVAAGKHSLKLADVEKEHIRSVLQSAGWRVRGTGGAADQLGMRPTTLETRMAKLGLARPRAS